MDLEILGTILYIVNIILSLLFTALIIDKLYISKKFSKEKNFHFYNDLFSWEMFYIFISIENILQILLLFLLDNVQISFFLLRIRILIMFFPFWTKIIHLERVMDLISYERHYFAGLIPLIIILVLGFTSLSNIILIFVFLFTTFIPFLIFFLFWNNIGTSRNKTLLIVFGACVIIFGYVFGPDILDRYMGFSKTVDIIIELTNIIAPISFIIGTLLIFNSFRKDL
ncbi:MAG: hypothetical protein ACFFCE_18750 [Promethearchaeota archaeon]